jgi:flagellar basal body-associated protein FliL
MIIIGGVIALIAVVIIVIISWRNADGDPSDSKQVEQPSAVSASGSRQPDGINEAHDASAILEPSGINALLDPANAATTNIAEEPQ